MNTLAFLFTVVGEWYVEGKVISRGTFNIAPGSSTEHRLTPGRYWHRDGLIFSWNWALCAEQEVAIPRLPSSQPSLLLSSIHNSQHHSMVSSSADMRTMHDRNHSPQASDYLHQAAPLDSSLFVGLYIRAIIKTARSSTLVVLRRKMPGDWHASYGILMCPYGGLVTSGPNPTPVLYNIVVAYINHDKNKVVVFVIVGSTATEALSSSSGPRPSSGPRQCQMSAAPRI